MGTGPSKPNVEQKDKPIIMVIGGPGTGKGTQCGRMVKEFGFKHISLGEILRAEVKQGTQIGKDCEAITKEGKLVPVNLTMELMKKALKQVGDANGYLLDGFPRATKQARAFKKEVREPSLVLYLHAPHQVLTHRLMQRGLTSGRADDNLNTIRKRLVTFKKESLPVVTYYEKSSTTVVKVCTITTPDDVYSQVRAAVKKMLSTPPRAQVKRRVSRRVTYGCHAKPRHRRCKKMSMEECPGHPPGSPVPPAPPQGCIIM